MTTQQYDQAIQHTLNRHKKEIEEFGTKVAKEHGYEIGGSIEVVVKNLGGTIKYADPFVPGYPDGTLVVGGPGKFQVILSSVSSPLRNRFTLAHELGHYILHSRWGKNRIKVNRGGSDQAEWEANWFAAGFLMPEIPFTDYVNKRYSNQRMAGIFRVSTAAIKIRRQSLGLET